MATARPGRQVRLVAAEQGWAGRFQAMGSPCEVLVDGGSKANAAALTALVSAEAWRIEDKFSRYLDGNIIHSINTAAGKPVEVDTETGNLLDFAATLFEISDGRFDISSGVLRAVWTFDGSDRIPSQEAIDAVLDRVGWQRAAWSGGCLTLEPGMEIDLGGIGKEYAVDRCTSLAGDASAIPAMINFGGDLAVTGPPRSRSAWKVGIEGPAADSADRLVKLRQGALATSGDARRFLLRDGVRYSHILDPTTGWPIPDAPSSVTVAADTCTQAGMMSTLAMLKGPDAESFLAAQELLSWCRR
ncbi:MAG: FAD:protein FMN transferase [Gammaproteobacteria bacterium]|nr:FAD:protein FMN transferase [Gammaproteobacteria bacterium]